MADPKSKTSYQGSFLFVNKDASNLKDRNAREAFEIGSHVNGRYSKWTRKQKLSLPKSAFQTEKQLSEDRRQSTGDCSGSARSLVGSPRGELIWRVRSAPHNPLTARIEKTLLLSPDLDESLSGLESSSDNSEHPGYVPDVTSPSLNVATVLRHGNSDPFGSAAFNVSPLVNHLLQTASEYRSSMIWATEAKLPTVSPVIEKWRQWTHSAIVNKSRFCIALSLGLAIKARTSPGQRAEYAAKSLYFKGLAYAYMQEMAKSAPVTEDTLFTVLSLYSLASYNYEPDHVVHFEAARRILSDVGGVTKLNRMQIEYISTVDTNRAYWAMENPRLTHYGEWDPGPLTPGLLKLVSRLRIRRGMMGAAESVDLSPLVQNPELRSILKDLREVIEVDDLRAGLRDIFEFNEIFRWLHLRQNACRMRLLEYYLEHASHSFEQIQNTTEIADIWGLEDRIRNICVCVATIYCILMIMESPGAARKTVRLPGRVEQALGICIERLSALPFDQNSELLLWASSMGAFNEQLYSEEGAVRWPHKLQFSKFATAFHVKSVDQIREVLRQFLYCDRVFRPALEPLCSGMNAKWKPAASSWIGSEDDTWNYT